MKKIITMSVIAAALALAGCGKSETPTFKTMGELNDETVLVPGQSWATETDGFIERRKKAAKEYPLTIDYTSRYEYFSKDHRFFADIYFANSKDAGIDEQIAEILDPTLMTEGDVFARKDRIKALAGPIAAYKEEVAKLSKDVYVITGDSVTISPYDHEKGGYYVDSWLVGKGVSIDWENYEIRIPASAVRTYGVSILPTYTNQNKVNNEHNGKHFIKVDEQKARQLEAYFATRRSSSEHAVNMPLFVKGYVFDTAKSDRKEYGTYIMPEELIFMDPAKPELSLSITTDDLAKVYRMSSNVVLGSAAREFNQKHNIN